MDDSACFVCIELGNILLKRETQEEVVRAYKAAVAKAPNDAAMRKSIGDQVLFVSTKQSSEVTPWRNPGIG